MKKFFLIFCLLLFFNNAFTQGYKIRGEIKNMEDTTVILAYYFGGKQYATDTADVVNGKLTFSADKKLDGGIYLLVLPDGKYFELIISEQKFSFTTDKDDLVSSMRFQNSKENTAFYKLQRKKWYGHKTSINLYDKCKDYYKHTEVPSTIVYFDEVRKSKKKEKVIKNLK